jgi:diguanylate cyclase (GGDEF)-like protein
LRVSNFIIMSHGLASFSVPQLQAAIRQGAMQTYSVFDKPRHQISFLDEGRLREVPTVRQLLRLLEPVTVESLCADVLERFLRESTIYALPVVNEKSRPVALVDRKHFIEFFSKPYSREIFGRRNILDLLIHEEYESCCDPVVVEDSCSIDDAAQIVIDAGMHHMVTGFVVTCEGSYLGVANGHDLLNIITQRRQAEFYYLAHYDSLTGIPNRMLLADRLEQACREAERRGDLVAILFVDIDRFKQINDSLGHRAGDAVLRKVVERLQASARGADTIARLGGDEFVILMEGLDDPSGSDLVAGRLIESMREPIEWLEHSLLVTLSIGIAIYPSDDTEISPLLAKADAAMYEAKSSGRNAFRRYSADTSIYNPAGLSLENELRRAIEEGELVLHYQPQVSLASMEVRGVEALVRWQHPERGMISPAHFVPLAEESGLIVPLGEWVLRQAFRQIEAWRAFGLPELRVSVNISALQFRHRGFTAFLRELLSAHPTVDARMVELELTESALMQNVDDVSSTLDEIKTLGFSLAIDDFGTGFSSLSYLRRFPIDRLKIDQSFVRDIESSPVNESIVRAIVALANNLSIDIVAEGIEKPGEKAVLEHLSCNEGQGFLFAKPLTADNVVAWLDEYRGNYSVADLFDLQVAGQ